MQQRIYNPFPWEDPPKNYAKPDSIFFGRLSKVTEANITAKPLIKFDDSLLFYSLIIAKRIQKNIETESLPSRLTRNNWNFTILESDKPYFVNDLTIKVDFYDGFGNAIYCTQINESNVDETISAVSTIVSIRQNFVNSIRFSDLVSAVYSILNKLFLIWSVETNIAFQKIKFPNDIEYIAKESLDDSSSLYSNILIDIFCFTKKNLKELLIAYLCGEQKLRDQIKYFFSDIILEDIIAIKERAKSEKKYLARKILEEMEIDYPFNKELEPLRDLLYKLQRARKTVEGLLDQIDSARYCFDIGLIDIISNLYIKIKQDI